jgi:transposase
MDQLTERCAGLDVHKKTVAACVRTPGPHGQRHQHTRTFQTTTKGLVALRDWLASQQVTVVGMESTGAYWKAVYYRLETTMECWLLNARHLRNVPGRKTDVADAAWICQLVEHGLVRPSFVPPPPIRELRNLTRYRKTVIQERTREAGAAGEAAGGRRHQAVVRGQRHPGRLRPGDAAGPSRRRARPPAAGRAGQGPPARQAPPAPGGPGRPLRPPPRAARGEVLARIDAADATIDRLSAEIGRVTTPYTAILELLETIPGVNRRTAEVILAETGGDMRQFPSAAHLASWAGLCPGNNESAGKHHSGRTRKGSKWLRGALVEAAHAAAHTKDTYLAAQYRRLGGRRNDKRAAVAVAHSILVIAYHILDRGQPYAELGGDWLLKRESASAHTQRLVRQLERLGHKVTLEPADAA